MVSDDAIASRHIEELPSEANQNPLSFIGAFAPDRRNSSMLVDLGVVPRPPATSQELLKGMTHCVVVAKRGRIQW